MPIKPAAKKALRQSEKKYEINKAVKDKIRFLTRKIKKHLKLNEKEQALSTTKELIKAVDKAAQKGILKKNNAARKKSRVMKKVNTAK